MATDSTVNKILLLLRERIFHLLRCSVVSDMIALQERHPTWKDHGTSLRKNDNYTESGGII